MAAACPNRRSDALNPMEWYAIHTKPRQEDLAVEALRFHEVEVFYPKLRRKKTIRRKYQWVTRPLFPRYLFSRFDYEQSFRLVTYANGVSNIVSFGGKPVSVNESIIQSILAHSVEEIVTIKPP